ncbi:MAG TPA: hypothetical protein DCG75_01630 [Bacteroidales bacterium]|nr:hypothetical protein [Bacteroidales bacterium]
MTTQEIYKLANEVTANEFNNVLNGFNQEETKSFETLVNLGDRKEVALFTVIAEKYNKLDNKEFYSNSYES